MEHLPVRLPHGAQLGEMCNLDGCTLSSVTIYHLKKKNKNKAKVEGSIVEQIVNEEI